MTGVRYLLLCVMYIHTTHEVSQEVSRGKRKEGFTK